MSLILKTFDGDTVPAVDLGSRTVSGWISRIEMDRDGEVVIPESFARDLEVYRENPILILSHQHKTLPIGKAIDLKVVPNEGVWAKYYITKNAVGDEVLTLLSEGILRGFSAGFVPIDKEDSPSTSTLPRQALVGNYQRPCKRKYNRVELVEVSLLAIPSNRAALVDRVEKGYKAAELIIKIFDNDTISDTVLKEWLGHTEEISLKSLFSWDESEHPRANDGKFTSSGSSAPMHHFDDERDRLYKPLPTSSTPSYDPIQDKMHQQQRSLETMVNQQAEMNRTLKEINNKDSWYNWAKKWVMRIAGAAGLYYGAKYALKNPTVKKKIREYLSDVIAGKGFEQSDESVDKFLSCLDMMKNFLDKGKELGLSDNDDYKKYESVYQNIIANLKQATIEEPSLKSLVDGIIQKEMSAEEFKEEEHPRAKDGKFKKKNSGTSDSGDTKKNEIKTSSNKKKSNSGVKSKNREIEAESKLSFAEKLQKAITEGTPLTPKDQLKFMFAAAAAYSSVAIVATFASNPKEFALLAKQMYREARSRIKGVGGYKTGMGLYDKAKDAEKEFDFYLKVHDKVSRPPGILDLHIDLDDTFEDTARILSGKKPIGRKTGIPNKGAYETPKQFLSRVEWGPYQKARGIEDLQTLLGAANEKQWATKMAYENWEDKYLGRKLRHPELEKKKKTDKIELPKIVKLRNLVKNLEDAKKRGEKINEGELASARDKIAKFNSKKSTDKGFFMRLISRMIPFFEKNKKIGGPIVKTRSHKAMETLLLTGDPAAARRQLAEEHRIEMSKLNEAMRKEIDDANIITKEMSSDTFVEEEHPRHADGKFRKKSDGSGVSKSKPIHANESIEHDGKGSATHPTLGSTYMPIAKENARKFYNWAYENKGKLIISAATIPIVFTGVKVGKNLNFIVNSKHSKNMVSWDEVIKSGKFKEFYSNIQPGDVILSGAMPPKTFGEIKGYMGDVIGILKNKRDIFTYLRYSEDTSAAGKAKIKTLLRNDVTPKELKKAYESYNRIYELMTKVGVGGNYGHSFMCLGHINDSSIGKIVEFGKTSPENKAKANEILKGLVVSIISEKKTNRLINEHIPVVKYMDKSGNLVQIPDNVKALKDFDFTKVDFTPFEGIPLVLKGGRGVPSLGVFINPHAGRPIHMEASAAVVRTGLPKDKIDKVVNGTFDDILNQHSTGIVHPWDKTVLARPAARGGLFDPITGRLISSLFRKDQVVCSGVIANYFERHGAKYFKDASIVSPMDFIKDKKFAKEVFYPKKHDSGIKIENEPVGKIRKENESPDDNKGKAVGMMIMALPWLDDIAVGAAAGGAYAHHKFTEDKGLANLYITKEMSAEQFDESEHPRDASGKFTDKPGSGATSGISPDKGSWGGTRAFSGRLPKDPITMKQRLEEKIKSTNPNIPDNELKQQLVDYAVQNKKTDLLQYIQDPVGYQKKRDEDLLLASQSRYNRVKTRTGFVDGPVTADDTEEASTGIKASVSKWNRTVQKIKDVSKAREVYLSENAADDERKRAKLLLGTATLVTGLGLWLAFRNRPRLNKSGFVYGGKLGEMRIPNAMGKTNPVELREKPGFTRLMEIINPPEAGGPVIMNRATQVTTEEIAIGSFRNKLGNALAWIGRKAGEDLPAEKQYVLMWGPKWKGFTGRFGIGEYNVFKKTNNYIMRPGDADAFTGLRLVDPGVKITEAGEKNVASNINLINLAMARKVIEDPNLMNVSGSALRRSPPGLSRRGTPNNYYWEYDPNRGGIEKFQQYLANSKQKVGRYVKTDKGIVYSVTEKDFPDTIARSWTEKQQEAFEKRAGAYKGWDNFLTSEIFPGVSRGVLATLSVGAGTTGGTYYYFQRDIEEYLRDYAKQKTVEPYISSESDKSGDPNLKLQIELAKQQKKLADAQAKAADKKTGLAFAREKNIDMLIKIGMRTPRPGARENYELDTKTISNHIDSILETLGYGKGDAAYTRFLNDLNAYDSGRANVKVHSNINIILETLQKRQDEDRAKSTSEGGTGEGFTYGSANRKEAGFDDDYVKKGFDGEEVNDDNFPSMEAAIPLLVMYLSQMFVDISQANKAAIESGLPGHSEHEELNDILAEIYSAMKDQVRENDAEITQKSVDSSDISGVMSSQDDSSGGLFVGKDRPKLNEKCPKCGKIANPDVVNKCEESSCPYNWVESIETKE